MPRILLLDYNKCRPEQCNSGICAAAQACPLHLLEQEERYEKPMLHSPVCKGCLECVKACPFEALEMS